MNADQKASPPKENAAPAEAEGGSFGKQVEESTGEAVTQESPMRILIMTWFKADYHTRRNFLSDIRAGMPNLWRRVDTEFRRDGGGR